MAQDTKQLNSTKRRWFLIGGVATWSTAFAVMAGLSLVAGFAGDLNLARNGIIEAILVGLVSALVLFGASFLDITSKNTTIFGISLFVAVTGVLGILVYTFDHNVGALTLRGLSFSQPVSISPDGSSLRITGSIPANLLDRMQAAAHCDAGGHHCRQFARIELESDGGSLDGAWAAAGALSSFGIKQAVATGICASACVAIWASAPAAAIGAGGVLGLHAGYNGSGQLHATDDTRSSDQRIIDLLVAKGAAKTVAEKGMTFTPNRLYYIGAGDVANWAPASGSSTRQN
jgi:hypothetical protein